METRKSKTKLKKQQADCCATEAQHPDHSEYLPRLNRVKGQIVGLERMIGERRYCVDILVQFRAVMAALRSIEVAMFESHLKHCVQDAMVSKDKTQIEAKISELTELLTRRTLL